MPRDDPDDDAGHYVIARRAGGLLLLGLVAVAFTIDVFLESYTFDSVQLGLLLGTACVLLGVDAAFSRLRQ